MAKASEFEKCALVIGILSTLEERHNELLNLLEENFGEIVAQSHIMDFSYTDYYNQEMGGKPVRYFLLFKNLVNPSNLAQIKLKTNNFEQCFADKVGRKINIDPGIMSLANFILATCKNRSHRIPLSNGVYGEVTLIYQNKDFQSLPWTYADYQSNEVKSVLSDFRIQYRSILRNTYSK